MEFRVRSHYAQNEYHSPPDTIHLPNRFYNHPNQVDGYQEIYEYDDIKTALSPYLLTLGNHIEYDGHEIKVMDEGELILVTLTKCEVDESC